MLPPLNAQISLTSLPLNVTMTPSETDADAHDRRRKDMALFVAALGFVASLSFVALWVAFLAAVTSKQQDWGMGVLLLIVGGCIGFLTGKNSK